MAKPDVVTKPDVTEEDVKEAKKRHEHSTGRRVDEIADFDASTAWLDKLEPEAVAWLETYKRIDQAVQISIAISHKRHIDFLAARPGPTATRAGDPAGFSENRGSPAEQDIRYSDGNDTSGIEYKWTTIGVRHKVAGASTHPTNKGSDGTDQRASQGSDLNPIRDKPF